MTWLCPAHHGEAHRTLPVYFPTNKEIARDLEFFNELAMESIRESISENVANDMLMREAWNLSGRDINLAGKKYHYDPQTITRALDRTSEFS